MPGPLGAAPGIMLGIGVGGAASAAIEPLLEPARQTAWANNRNRILTPQLNAALVAQGAISLDAGRSQSHREGLSDDKFDALVWLAQRAPTYAEAQDLRRRGKISRDQLLHAFAKQQIEPQYWDALADLVDLRLSPEVVAIAMVRGLIKDEGILPVGPPTAVGKIKAFPVSSIDGITEAAAGGFNRDRLAVLAGIAGRPPGPELMAHAQFRQLIEHTDYLRAIAEGDVRNEWAQAILDVTRQILTAHDYAELELRGFLTADQRTALTDQWGMSHTDSDRLVDLLGRSISVHQVTTGLARGGKYPGSYQNVPEPYRSAIQRSNIRQEWAELDYANRFSLPPPFVIRSLLTDGVITAAEGEHLYLGLGWPPDLAHTAAAHYAGSAAPAAANPWVKRAETQLWTAAHKAYIGGVLDDATADSILSNVEQDTAARAEVLQLWLTEKNLEAQPRPA